MLTTFFSKKKLKLKIRRTDGLNKLASWYSNGRHHGLARMVVISGGGGLQCNMLLRGPFTGG